MKQKKQRTDEALEELMTSTSMSHMDRHNALRWVIEDDLEEQED